VQRYSFMPERQGHDGILFGKHTDFTDFKEQQNSLIAKKSKRTKEKKIQREYPLNTIQKNNAMDTECQE
ncbi:MAG: hypothetical protein LUD00_11630, partial [Prevotellaceae bacterium]|nr:hypothetical protein [Prevotellaceae bacterium]